MSFVNYLHQVLYNFLLCVPRRVSRNGHVVDQIMLLLLLLKMLYNDFDSFDSYLVLQRVTLLLVLWESEIVLGSMGRGAGNHAVSVIEPRSSAWKITYSCSQSYLPSPALVIKKFLYLKIL